MTRKLPPLNALRAFEAAARHMSLTTAAAELHVTQAAVSHQVKSLEDHVGVKLFRRLPRGLLLTEAGQRLLPELREAFDRLARAVTRLDADSGKGQLAISLTTTMVLWLVPRLARFQAAHPGIAVKLMSSIHAVDFTVEDVDAAIRFGNGRWPGLRADKLFDDVLTPLCSPGLAAQLKSYDDLRRVPIITLWDDPDEWPIWLKAAGLEGFDYRGGPQFDSTRIAVQAAIAGVGVAIGPAFMYAEEIAAGRLCQPFALTAMNKRSWHFVSPERTADRPKIRAFREWLLGEAAAALKALPAPASETAPARSRRRA